MLATGTMAARVDVSGLGITAVDFATQIDITGGGSAVISTVEGSITLLGVNASTINQTDFFFA